jgi:hypothetical protein
MANSADQLKSFSEAIAIVKTRRADVVETSILSFKDDPELFYKAMDLAYKEGVPVMLAPAPKMDGKN